MTVGARGCTFEPIFIADRALLLVLRPVTIVGVRGCTFEPKYGCNGSMGAAKYDGSTHAATGHWAQSRGRQALWV